MVSLYEKIGLKILGSTVESSPSEELLGITIDSELTFHKHITSLCSKAYQKLSALARITKYTIDKEKILLNSFITAQFNYCPLIWMCHSRTLNNNINRIHERALKIFYNDYKSDFKELLERDHSFIIHERNIQYLANEAYKVKNRLSPVIMNAVFQFGKNSVHELRSGNYLQRTNIQTVHFGSESIKALGAKLWHLVPAEIKASKSRAIFKKK